MSLFVDTSVWSLALRRNTPATTPETQALVGALQAGQLIASTGIILQELLQGFAGPRDRTAILSHFSAIPLITPDRDDHIDAADLRNHCRRRGVQVGTVDALLAHLCIRHGLTMLSSDDDFRYMSQHCPLILAT